MKCIYLMHLLLQCRHTKALLCNLRTCIYTLVLNTCPMHEQLFYILEHDMSYEIVLHIYDMNEYPCNPLHDYPPLFFISEDDCATADRRHAV